MSGNNTRVDVCVATYKRPAMLKKLLHSLGQQKLDSDTEMRIFVVDNDAAGSACEVVECYATAGTVIVDYAKEPVQNIALARNRALSLCSGDYVAFIDDDEEATPDWLRYLLLAARTFQADVVFGPVIPIYPEDTPRWVHCGCFFERARYRTGTPRPHGATNNALVSRKTLEETEAQFDPDYGRTGGEDTKFFYQLGQQGARMVWCDEALVDEAVPHERMTPGWLIRRAYRGGQMYARIFMAPKSAIARVPWVAQRFSYLVVAVAMLPLAWLLGKGQGVRVLMKISSNLGHLTSLTGRLHEGYR